MREEWIVRGSDAHEVCKLIREHLKEGGPFNDHRLCRVLEALDSADRVVILDEDAERQLPPLNEDGSEPEDLWDQPPANQNEKG